MCDCPFASTALQPVVGGGYSGNVLLPYFSGQTCESSTSGDCDLDVSTNAVCQDGRCYGTAEVFVDGRADGYTIVRPVRVRGCEIGSYPSAGKTVSDMAAQCSADPACIAFADNDQTKTPQSTYTLYSGLPAIKDIGLVAPGDAAAKRLYIKDTRVSSSSPPPGCGPLGPPPPPPSEPSRWALLVLAVVVVLGGAFALYWFYFRHRAAT